ncbi:hypothetical protein BJ912DRAFT_1036717, partial [Pholiota molesta]
KPGLCVVERYQRKVALLSVQCLAFSILAVATVGNCNVGTILCCSSVGPPTPEDIELWSLLGTPPLQGLIGTGCTAFSATGPGSIGEVSVES